MTSNLTETVMTKNVTELVLRILSFDLKALNEINLVIF